MHCLDQHAELAARIGQPKLLPVDETYVLVRVYQNVITPEVDHSKAQICLPRISGRIFHALDQDFSIRDTVAWENIPEVVYHIRIELIYQA